MDSAAAPGRTIARVTIAREIGRSPSSTVYAGFHAGLQRTVAIKIVPKVNGAGRLLAEATRNVVSLSHPNIVPLFEAGEAREFRYQIMGLIEGETLRTIIKRRLASTTFSLSLIPLRETVKITDAILDALSYAHGKGIVHLDVKPSNIIIDRSGIPFLLDFGLALPMANVPACKGVVVGSALYMSPEQASAGKLDGRSDIYAMGVVLFEMAAGILPVAPVSAEEIIQCKRVAPDSFFTVKPSEASPLISEALERVILKATASRPGDRYQVCAQFKRDLDKCVKNKGRSQ